MTNTQIDAKVFELDMLEAQIKELNALVKARKSELKAELDERQIDMIDTGVNRVWYKLVETHNLDNDLAKAELEKIGKLNDCMKSNVKPTFRITKSTNR